MNARNFGVTRFVGEGGSSHADDVAVEEPLEIRISGETLAVTMRTPGNDREIACGFLLAEGVITSRDDVGAMVHCQDPRTDPDARDNTIDVTLAPGVKPPIDADSGMLARRGTLVSSACGVCGRRSIDDLLARIRPLPDGPVVTLPFVREAVASLRDAQPLFAKTGGCHAASLVPLADGERVTFEDVGRHNAVDKAIGSRVLAGATASNRMLVVSGRASFEIVQKALAAGIPIVCSVSAPSSLAIELARKSNVTLVGFVRGERLTIYSGDARIAQAAAR